MVGKVCLNYTSLMPREIASDIELKIKIHKAVSALKKRFIVVPIVIKSPKLSKIKKMDHLRFGENGNVRN